MPRMTLVSDALGEASKPRVRVPAGSSRIDNTPEAVGRAFVEHALRKRDLPVIEWVAHALGRPLHEVAAQMLTDAVMREKPAYREAHGKGGNSSRSAEALAQRLSPPT